MKKFLSIALALVMVLSLGAVAFADEPAEPVVSPTPTNSITLTKVYGVAGSSNAVSPAETFTFENITCSGITYPGTMVNGSVVTTSDAPSVTVSSVSYAAGAAGSTNKEGTITINYGDFPAVGIYTYTFNEKDNGTAGVSYLSGNLFIVFNVTQGDNGLVVVAGVKKANGSAKITSFDDNMYSAGSLTVSKKVTGSFGEVNRAFDMTVTFTAPSDDTVRSTITYGGNQTISPSEWVNGSVSKTIQVKQDSPVTFDNIPYGVTYSVVEAETYAKNDGYDAAKYDSKSSGTISAASVSTEVTNNKNGTIETGVSMDSIPYVVLLTVACLGLVVLLTKKRTARDF